MVHRSNWVAILTLCSLPAIGIGVRTTHVSFVASFFYACPTSHPTPRVHTHYATAERFPPYSEWAVVAVFLRGHTPERHFRPVGDVEVLARSPRTRAPELIEYARQAARDMGGDLVVDVDWRDAASTSPKAGAPGRLFLTAHVARWE